jgi:hypothetical protein
MIGRPPNKPENIWNGVSNYGDSTKCWEWQRTTCRGYGQIRIGNKRYYVHRIAYELIKGDRNGLLVLHKCDNRLCCNPDHLFLGTNKDNTQDMITKGRRWCNKGEVHPMSKLKEKEIREIFRLKAVGWAVKEIAVKFCVHIMTVYSILERKSWQHVAISEF